MPLTKFGLSPSWSSAIYPHVDDDVRRVGDLDADLGDLRAGRAHDVGHDVHLAALHGAVEQRPDSPVGLGGRHPVVGGAGFVSFVGADEGQVLDACDVLRIATREIAAGVAVLVELVECTAGELLAYQSAVLLIRAVAPDHLVRLRETAQ